MASVPRISPLQLDALCHGQHQQFCQQQEVSDRSSTAVRVALRVRPLVPRDRLDGAKNCVAADPAACTVLLARQRQFTFDHVYDQASSQQQVYTECVAELVEACLEGYNATVLAYGPTGSGKTFTMGSASTLHSLPDEQGIIPRAIRQLFQGVEASAASACYSVRAQFLEIYNEEVRDLLAPGPGAGAGAAAAIAIREAPDGQILVTGAREEPVSCYEDLVRLLDVGANARATGATSLNEHSSRSHAIFTIIVEQSILSSSSGSRQHTQQQQQQQPLRRPPSGAGSASSCCDGSDASSGAGEEEAGLRRSSGSGLVTGMVTPRTRLLQQLNKQVAGSGVSGSLDSSSEGYWGEAAAAGAGAGAAGGDEEAGSCSGGAGGVLEYRCAKFHLVDLAGSERTKRSGVVGVRFREAVTINQGLLTLGNVISALGDERRRASHVPYRDSKLTRLLQDSLGGNAKTTMIACISCADDCLEESLNTLKYAQRARRIKNRPVVNRERLASVSALQQEIQALQWALLKRLGGGLGPDSLLHVPDLLLADLSQQPPSLAVLHQLRALAANAGEWGSSTSSSQDSAHQLQQQQQRQREQEVEQQRMAAEHKQRISSLHQQLASTTGQLEDANTAVGSLAAELAATKAAVTATATAAATEAAAAALRALAQEVQQQVVQLAAGGGITAEAQAALLATLGRHTRAANAASKAPGSETQPSPPDLQQEQQQGENIQVAAAAPQPAQQRGIGLAAPQGLRPLSPVRRSVQSYPLPAVDASTCDERAVFAIKAAAAAAVAMLRGSQGRLPGTCPAGGSSADTSMQEDLQQQLAAAQEQLAAAQADLAQDDAIFSDKQRELQGLRSQLAAAQEAAVAQQAAAAAQMVHLQHELNRWRSQALALYSSPPSSPKAAAAAAAAGGVNSPTASAGSPTRAAAGGAGGLEEATDLAGEPSFAAGFPSLPQRAPSSAGGAGGAAGEPAWHPQPAAAATVEEGGGVGGGAGGGLSWPMLQLLSEDSQVVYDDELMSYISDTDYAELAAMAAEEGTALQQELQQVLADRAALASEKRQAEEAAAELQREFERARGVMEAQLRQLSAHMNSKEALIAALQRSEAEARLLSAQYQERCAQLEAAIADKASEVELLQAAMVEVEADVLASAEDKAAQRAAHEARITALQDQLEGLRKQLKDQHGLKLDKERQRTGVRIQSLQADLRSMRDQQEALRQQLADKVAAHGRAASERNKELVALRRAGEAARKRMAELEAENRRARAALAAKADEVAAAKQRIRQLTQQQAASPRPQRATRRLSGGGTPTAGSLRSSRADSSCFASPRGRGAGASDAGTPRSGRGRPSDTDTPCSLSPRSPRPSGQESPASVSPRQQHTTASAARAEAAVVAEGDSTNDSGSGGIVSVSVAAWCSQQLRAYSLQHQLRQEVARLAGRQEQLQQQTQELQAVLGHSSSTGGTGLQQGLEDELDAAGMELGLVSGQLEAAAQQLAAAQQAAEALQAQAGELQEGDVRLLLQRMLQQLVEQSMRNKQTRAQARQLALALQEHKSAAASAQDRMALQGWDHQLALTELTRAHEERVAGLLSQAAGTAAASSSQDGSSSARTGLVAEGSSSSSRSSGSMGSGARLSLSASTGRLTQVLGKLLNRPMAGTRLGVSTGKFGNSSSGNGGSSNGTQPKTVVRFKEPVVTGDGEGLQEGLSHLLSRRCPDLKLASLATPGQGVVHNRSPASHPEAPMPPSSLPGPGRTVTQENGTMAAACSSPRPPSPTSCSSPHPSSPAARGGTGFPGVTTPPGSRSPGPQALRSSSQALQEQLRAYKAHLRQVSSSNSGGGGLGSPGASRSKPRSPLAVGDRLPGSPFAPASRQQQQQQGGHMQQEGVGAGCMDSDTGPALQLDTNSPHHASTGVADTAVATKVACGTGGGSRSSARGGEAGEALVQERGPSPALGLRGRLAGGKEGRVRQGVTSRSAYLAALADVAPGSDTGGAGDGQHTAGGG